MKLYEVIEAYQDLMNLEDIDEETFRTALGAVHETLDQKICSIGRLVRNIEADSNALKAEEERLYKKRKAIEKTIERLKQYALDAMVATGRTKATDGIVTFSTQLNPPKVVVDPDADIPLCWYVEKVERNLDKNAIKQALVSGATIPGCTLVAETGIRLK